MTLSVRRRHQRRRARSPSRARARSSCRAPTPTTARPRSASACCASRTPAPWARPRGHERHLRRGDRDRRLGSRHRRARHQPHRHRHQLGRRVAQPGQRQHVVRRTRPGPGGARINSDAGTLTLVRWRDRQHPTADRRRRRQRRCISGVIATTTGSLTKDGAGTLTLAARQHLHAARPRSTAGRPPRRDQRHRPEQRADRRGRGAASIWRATPTPSARSPAQGRSPARLPAR